MKVELVLYCQFSAKTSEDIKELKSLKIIMVFL